MAKVKGIPIYVFDLESDSWFWWNAADNRFQSIHEISDIRIHPPTLQNHTAIVGTREPHQGYLVELQRLFSFPG